MTSDRNNAQMGVQCHIGLRRIADKQNWSRAITFISPCIVAKGAVKYVPQGHKKELDRVVYSCNAAPQKEITWMPWRWVGKEGRKQKRLLAENSFKSNSIKPGDWSLSHGHLVTAVPLKTFQPFPSLSVQPQ